jgi:hypothetical protein
MKKIWITAGVALLTLGITRTLWAEQEAQQSPQVLIGGYSPVLKGVKGFHVFVHLSDNVAKLGVTKEQVESRVELALRRNGVPVLSLEEGGKTLGRPYLRAALVGGQDAVSVRLECREDMFLVREPGNLVQGVETYLSGGITFSTSSDGIYKALDKHTDKFCLEWLRENPKESR